MVQRFNDAKSGLQFKDKEAGIVKGKYLLKVGLGSDPSFYSVITIRVRDRVSRIEISAPA